MWILAKVSVLGFCTFLSYTRSSSTDAAKVLCHWLNWILAPMLCPGNNIMFYISDILCYLFFFFYLHSPLLYPSFSLHLCNSLFHIFNIFSIAPFFLVVFIFYIYTLIAFRWFFSLFLHYWNSLMGIFHIFRQQPRIRPPESGIHWHSRVVVPIFRPFVFFSILFSCQ